METKEVKLKVMKGKETEIKETVRTELGVEEIDLGKTKERKNQIKRKRSEKL